MQYDVQTTAEIAQLAYNLSRSFEGNGTTSKQRASNFIRDHPRIKGRFDVIESTQDFAFLYDKQADAIVVAIRGTEFEWSRNCLRDISNDADAVKTAAVGVVGSAVGVVGAAVGVVGSAVGLSDGFDMSCGQRFATLEAAYTKFQSDHPEYKGLKVTAVGHSLGGAEAVGLANAHPGMDAVAFNPYGLPPQNLRGKEAQLHGDSNIDVHFVNGDPLTLFYCETLGVGSIHKHSNKFPTERLGAHRLDNWYTEPQDVAVAKQEQAELAEAKDQLAAIYVTKAVALCDWSEIVCASSPIRLREEKAERNLLEKQRVVDNREALRELQERHEKARQEELEKALNDQERQELEKTHEIERQAAESARLKLEEQELDAQATEYANLCKELEQDAAVEIACAEQHYGEQVRQQGIQTQEEGTRAQEEGQSNSMAVAAASAMAAAAALEALAAALSSNPLTAAAAAGLRAAASALRGVARGLQAGSLLHSALSNKANAAAVFASAERISEQGQKEGATDRGNNATQLANEAGRVSSDNNAAAQSKAADAGVKKSGTVKKAVRHA